MRNDDGFESLSAGAKFGVVCAVMLALGLIGLGLFRVTFLTFVDNYELGYIYYGKTGQIERMTRTGYVYTTPILNSVHAIDLRPGQVCMNANSRVLNCKLVKFNPEGFAKFIEWHGRGAGDRGGRVDDQGQAGIYEILKSYAFNVNEGRDCPFLIILDDMRRKDVSSSLPTETPKVEVAQ